MIALIAQIAVAVILVAFFGLNLWSAFKEVRLAVQWRGLKWSGREAALGAAPHLANAAWQLVWAALLWLGGFWS